MRNFPVLPADHFAHFIEILYNISSLTLCIAEGLCDGQRSQTLKRGEGLLEERDFTKKWRREWREELTKSRSEIRRERDEGEVKEGEISHSEMKPKEERWMRRKRGGLEAEGDTRRLPQDCR